jgi:hypothetical protein
MPGHTDKGTKNYRNMMKNMEKNMMRPDDIEPTTRDMLSSETLKPFEDDILEPPMPMSKFDEMLRKQLMNKTDPKSVVREGEMDMMKGTGGMIEQLMGSLSMADRDAIEALTTMGISLEDAVEAILDPNAVARRDEMLEGAVGATMGAGALGALPMRKPSTVMREGEMGADRTQSMDMQKEGMGT